MSNHFSTNDIGAGFTSILSMISASFAVITVDGVHNIMSLVSSGIAIVSGLLSSRYFYKQSKKVK
jgi:hypothetical protein